MFLLDYLYKDQRWSDYCIPLALVVSVVTLSCSDAIGYLMTLIWLQFAVYLVHQTEEHFWPGGFRDFINQHIFKSFTPAQPLTDSIIFCSGVKVVNWLVAFLYAPALIVSVLICQFCASSLKLKRVVNVVPIEPTSAERVQIILSVAQAI